MKIFLITFLHLLSALCIFGRKQQSLQGSCVLPEKPDNGNYEVAGCTETDFSSKCREIPGTIVSQSDVLIYSCNTGFVLEKNNKHSVCSYGDWDPVPPKCLKLCEGLSSNSLALECSHLGIKVDCEKPAIPGTKLRAKCLDTYHVTDPSASFISTECLPDGTWANQLYRCAPDCGIRNLIKGNSTIEGDSLLGHIEFPWHAGLYFLEGQDHVNYCGGTIIHPKAVLTVANCVYNLNRTIDTDKIAVAVGKYRSDWNIKEATEQNFKVIEIHIPNKYVGYKNKHENNIAILILDRFIKINVAAMPICFDRSEGLSLHKGANAVGLLVTWGATVTGSKINDVLRVVKFHFLELSNCLKNINLDTSILTYDKFCARSNDTGFLERDNGTALTFPRFTYGVEQHFIYGLVNLHDGNGLAVFTNITEHMKWINSVLKPLSSLE